MSDFDRFDDYSFEGRRETPEGGRNTYGRQTDGSSYQRSYRSTQRGYDAPDGWDDRQAPAQDPWAARTERIERQTYDGPRQADRNQYWSSRHNERAASRQSSRTGSYQRIPSDPYDEPADERPSYERPRSTRQSAERRPSSGPRHSANPRSDSRGRQPQRGAASSRSQQRTSSHSAPRAGMAGGSGGGADRYLSSYPMPSRRRWLLIAIAAIAILLIAGIVFGVTHIGKGDSGATAATNAQQLEANDKMQADAPAEPTSITVSAVGDMIFGRNVGDLIDSEGGEAPLAHVADILAASDVTIGNLESPLADGGDAQTWKDVILIGRPAAIEGLKACDFTFVSLANNHMLDYGEPALRDTLATLDEAGIGHAGAGMNSTEAWQAATAEVEGKKIAFLSFSDILPDGFVAGESKPGIAAARLDMDKVCTVIKAYKQTNDYVFVSFHWGIEYEDYAIDDQIDEAHQAVDAGADAIFSEHPHVIQGVEFYNGALIAYSLGDFVFDHYSRKTGESFILQLELTDNGIENVVAIPTYLDGYGAPAVVYDDEATTILNRLDEISYGMNMTMEQRDSVGYLRAADA